MLQWLKLRPLRFSAATIWIKFDRYPSRPRGQRRQRHQNRLDVAASHQAELGAAVVDQIEFGVADAACVNVEEREPDVAHEGEIARPSVRVRRTRVEVVEEDAADPARLAAVL